MSSETLLVSAGWDDGGTPRHERLVARLAPDPADVPVFPQLRPRPPVRGHPAGRRPDRRAGAGRVVVRARPRAAGGAVLRHGPRRGRVPPDVMPYTFGDNWPTTRRPRTSGACRTPASRSSPGSTPSTGPRRVRLPRARRAGRHAAGPPAGRRPGLVRLGGRRRLRLPADRAGLRLAGGALAGRRGPDGAQLGRLPDRQRPLRRVRTRRGARLGDGHVRAPASWTSAG